jgi:hypothetical protein
VSALTIRIVTDYGVVSVSEKTIAAMDATYPGWRDLPLRGRARAIKHYNQHARQGEERLTRAARAIAALAFDAAQELVEI